MIRVEDGDLRNPDLVVTGSLPHVVQLTVTPMVRFGIPDFRDSRGRAALLRVASGRVRLGGDGRTQGVGDNVLANTLTGNAGYGLKVMRRPQGRIAGTTFARNRRGRTNQMA